MARRTQRRRWPWVLLTTLIALVTLFYIGLGYYFSSAIYHDVFEVRPGVPATTQTGILTDLTVPTNQVEGTVTVALDSQYAAPDKYANATVGIKVGDSLIVAGPATESTGGAVTRPSWTSSERSRRSDPPRASIGTCGPAPTSWVWSTPRP